MKRRDLGDLVLLAALWGSSFLFMRLAVPSFGTVPMSGVRVAVAGLMLLPLLIARGEGPALRRHCGRIAVLALTNSALPFLCFGYAAHTLPAGLAAVFNAGTPLAVALLGWVWLGDPLNRWRSLGLALGFAGVVGLAAVKSGLAAGRLDMAAAPAVAACLAATLMYGHAANYSRRHLQGVPPMALAAGTQLAAGLYLALPTVLTWPAQNPPPVAWASVLALAALCSALAYILYFRLLAHVGPTSASSVTFLVPVFATLWGALVLHEGVTLAMGLGFAVIIAGTALVLGLWPRRRG